MRGGRTAASRSPERPEVPEGTSVLRCRVPETQPASPGPARQASERGDAWTKDAPAISGGTWRVAAAAVFVCGWGGNQFTPLLVLYRQAGQSPLTVNALLGAYVVGLVPGLLVAAPLAE